MDDDDGDDDVDGTQTLKRVREILNCHHDDVYDPALRLSN